MMSDDVYVLKSSLAYYEKMSKEGIYFTREQFLELKKSIKRDAVIEAANICSHCGSDGESWQSELEQVAIKMEKGEL